jgi:subtilase family serine protease
MDRSLNLGMSSVRKGILMTTPRRLRYAFVVALLLSSTIEALAQTSSVSPLNRVDPNNQRKNKVVGLTPAQIRKAYGFDKVANQGAGQTIAIVSAFDLPTIESDLATFSNTSGLPACTVASGCLKISNAAQTLPPTTSDPLLIEAFQTESALDVEWAHAIAPAAKIVLVQSADARVGNMLEGVNHALTFNPSVVSMSWGIGDTTTRSYSFAALGVSFVAASGDFGTPAMWPAANTDVTAVGGTKLNITSKGDYNSEHAWADSGGGVSTNYPQGAYQLGISPINGLRGVPDVSYDGDPNTGVAMYSATLGGWSQIGGTSIGAPQWAGLLAIANSMRVAASKLVLTGANNSLYLSSYLGGFNDITSGPNNGKCGPLCKAGPGYDYLTGLGSPKANVLIPALVSLP